jgi:hypothetical protein
VAGVAPRLPSADGLQAPLLPLVRLEDGAFMRPEGVVQVPPARDQALILAADEDFTPVPTRTAFKAADQPATLTVKRGTRGTPAEGDFLLVIDFERQRSVLVRVAGAVSELEADWNLPVVKVEVTEPAWSVLASSADDVQLTMPAGSSVVRFAPPILYQMRDGRLVRSAGNAHDILAFGTTSFRVERDADTDNNAWLVSFELEGEAVEASADSDWKQRAVARLSIAPAALNSGN